MEIEFKSHVFRRAKNNDTDAILEFIRQEWNGTHIYAQSKEFFLYEFLCGHYLNANIAVEKSSNRIDAIHLYYPQKEEPEGSDIFGGLSRVRQSCTVPMLGVNMSRKLLELTGGNSYSAVGINPNTSAQLMRFIEGQRVLALHQYYRLANKTHYHIAKIRKKEILPCSPCTKQLIRILTLKEAKNMIAPYVMQAMRPHKDFRYLNRKYFSHPIYNYHIYGIQSDAHIIGVLIGREIKQNGACVFRIIDYFGAPSAIEGISAQIDQLITKNNYEYIDFYQYGISKEIMESAGFLERKSMDINIIPNYFEPYILENINLLAHSDLQEPFCLFKGNSDQDRPNILPK